MSITPVTLIEVKLIWLMYVWLFFNRYTCIYTHEENPPNPKLTVCATFKSFKFENLLCRGDLENKVKVKLITCNKIFCYYAPWV